MRLPFEFMHEHAERDGRVDAAAGDDHLRARIERGLYRACAEVGIGGEHAFRQRRAALQFAHWRLRLAQLRQQGRHVVAAHHRNLQRDALFGGECRQCVGAALRVHAACVAHHPDALFHGILQHRFHRHRDEVGRIAQLGFLEARAREDRHGEFGQVVEHEVVDLPAAHELRRADAAVAPEAGGAADADDALVVVHRPLHCGLRFSRKASCPSAASSVSANRPIWLSVKAIDSSKAIASIFFMV